MTTLNYDGRVFRSAAAETADAHGVGPTGHYHQDGNVVWAEFAGGAVVRGSLVGSRQPDGSLRLAYCQLLRDGQVISGECHSTPTVLPDGRIRLREEWRRFSPTPDTGVSHIEQINSPHQQEVSHMQLINGAGQYTPAKDDEPNHWIEHLVTPELSLGTYSIPAGGLDDQRPHFEDEIYLVTSGRATLVTDSGSVDVAPGSVVYVPSQEKHQFTSITEDLTLVVIVAPPYKSREPEGYRD